MRQLKLFRWAAAVMLAIALLPGIASAQEDGTITISSTFTMDGLDGTVGADLAEVFANGHEHTWTLTLHGTTQTHHRWSSSGYRTKIHATSFDLEFFGPDAATLNGIVSEHIAGGEARIDIVNTYGSGGDGFALWVVQVFGSDFGLETGTLDDAWYPLFPSDVDGYPVVGPEAFSICAEYSYLSGNGGIIWSWEPLVTFEGSVGGPEPVVLAVADASVLEGDRGPSTVAVAVTLSSGSSQEITVSYRTVDGTAKAKEDYNATSGTLTFQPGETSRTIFVSIKGDRKREADEAFTVQLSNAVGATIGSATVTILNDD